MAVPRVKLELSPAGIRTLKQMKDPALRKTITRALKIMAFKVQRAARDDFIIRGGPLRGPADSTRITSRTGRGRASIQVDETGVPKIIAIGSGLVYMAAHETGTTRLPPRPWLQPAFDQESKNFETIMLNEWQREVYKA